ncbi:2-keto-3-deoxygluconate permease [Sporomusa acidovorans]|uniref:2-keto-3-deoxygluconate permease n=1 Tax=Sporomusa acidovorans (strain ATCC 49682 / DSM 3132 / Mol) TaxID=1123286 RepID=A0ABZ3J663_SPOA4|nr:2-keto-3-deoxygluconate permease [Sporomusa acidovorans]OZC15694.1 2-keto-3-deoxygluconate permease [Sporomusa acidovorans DSM 3132]SDE89095.1 2-keto-3-deoxygluconate permease [Sporomusa acidovorans]
MQIYKRVRDIPGGFMIVPMLIGALINTFAPHFVRIGGFTEAIATSFPAFIGAFLFCMGTTMTFKAAPIMLKRGCGILFTKVSIASVIALMIAKFFGGDLFGLSALAILAAMNDTNGGMFIALTSGMGDETDVGSYVIQNIETGPFLTMVVLAGTGLANIPYMAMVSLLVPLVLGFILGNLDKDIREYCGARCEILLPYVGFALGNTINLYAVVTAGFSGLLLGFATCIITGFACITVDRLLGGSGVAGAAASSTAGNAAATPKAVAMADPAYAAIAPIATLQVAASVIVTSVLTPILTTFVYRRVKAKKMATEEA